MNFLALLGLTVLAGLIGAGFAGVTITVFLHRGITHGSHRMKRPVYEAGRWLTFFVVFMRHWEWRRIHRKHHKYTDVWIDEVRHDPHSPVIISQREGIDGYRRVSWHMGEIFHAEAKLPDIQDDTFDDPKLDRPFDWLDHRVFFRPVFGAVTAGLVYTLMFALFAPTILGVPRSAGWELAATVAGRARARSPHCHRFALRRGDQLGLPPSEGVAGRRGLREERQVPLRRDLRRG